MTDIDDQYLDRLEEYGPIAKSLSMCLRPTFVAEKDNNTLIWGDWSSIEARILPWLPNSPGGDKVLDVFRAVDADPDAADIYMIEGANIHGLHPENDVLAGCRAGDKEMKGIRQEGKVAVLSLGFGGGTGALLAMAAGYGLHIGDNFAAEIVAKWRQNNQWAVKFWSELKDAFIRAYQNPNGVFPAGRVAYMYDPSYHGGTIFCALPDGRVLTYPSIKYRTIEKTDKKTGDKYKTEALTYRKGYKWGAIWHGILAENPTQAVAASILRAKLKQLDKEGRFPVRFHTHDEIGGEAPQEIKDEMKRYLKGVMEEPLEWSDGLPLVAEVTDNWYYSKAVE